MPGERYKHTTSDGQPKRRFAKKKDAKATAKLMQKRLKKKFDVYACPECLGYHIGSSNRNKKNV